MTGDHSPEAAAKFQAVIKAKDTLLSPRNRAEFDATWRRENVQQVAAEQKREEERKKEEERVEKEANKVEKARRLREVAENNRKDNAERDALIREARARQQEGDRAKETAKTKVNLDAEKARAARQQALFDVCIKFSYTCSLIFLFESPDQGALTSDCHISSSALPNHGIPLTNPHPAPPQKRSKEKSQERKQATEDEAKEERQYQIENAERKKKLTKWAGIVFFGGAVVVFDDYM